VAATTTTTIRGVSLLSTQRRSTGDAFDLTLSPDGIEIRRSGRPVQHMSWNRVSQWEIEEHKEYLVLTLRGDGAATSLFVPGWTLEQLETLLRQLTPDSGRSSPRAAPDQVRAPAAHAPDEPTSAGSRAERRRRQRLRFPWKAVVTVVLLVALAASVTLVLLQSAGIIDWGFLGPTA